MKRLVVPLLTLVFAMFFLLLVQVLFVDAGVQTIYAQVDERGTGYFLKVTLDSGDPVPCILRSSMGHEYLFMLGVEEIRRMFLFPEDQTVDVTLNCALNSRTVTLSAIDGAGTHNIVSVQGYCYAVSENYPCEVRPATPMEWWPGYEPSTSSRSVINFAESNVQADPDEVHCQFGTHKVFLTDHGVRVYTINDLGGIDNVAWLNQEEFDASEGMLITGHQAEGNTTVSTYRLPTNELQVNVGSQVCVFDASREVTNRYTVR